METGNQHSRLNSEGPVTEGSTRHCDFVPFGAVNERIKRHELHQRLTVYLYETFKMPISGAVADFNIADKDSGTELNLHYSCTPNLIGRLMRATPKPRWVRALAVWQKPSNVKANGSLLADRNLGRNYGRHVRRARLVDRLSSLRDVQ